MIKNLTLSDDDLSLRPITAGDIEMLRNWRNQDFVRNRFVFSDSITSEQQVQWFEKYNSDDTDYMFIVSYESNPIGAAALYHINMQKGHAEFGRLMLGDLSKRGQGLGKRITHLTTRMGFEVLSLKRIYLEVFEENNYAFKIYRELGYKVIEHAIKGDKRICSMEILKGEIKP